MYIGTCETPEPTHPEPVQACVRRNIRMAEYAGRFLHVFRVLKLAGFSYHSAFTGRHCYSGNNLDNYIVKTMDVVRTTQN